MRIPNKVIVCGKEVPVEFVDVIYYTKDGDTHITDGEYDSLHNKIELAENLKVIRGKRLATDVVEHRNRVDTFYHELFHCICFNMLGDSDISSEPNAQTFASIATQLISDGYDESKMLPYVLSEFKKIVTDIPEQDLRRLEYAINNTELIFDEDVSVYEIAPTGTTEV